MFIITDYLKYSNIKRAFFQPPDNEVQIILHFHLKVCVNFNFLVIQIMINLINKKNKKSAILFEVIFHSLPFSISWWSFIRTLSFRWKNAILIGKKQHKDISFYTEIGETQTDLAMTRFQRSDRDEFEAEQRERRMRKKLKQLFCKFFAQIEEETNNRVMFEVPNLELGFPGKFLLIYQCKLLCSFWWFETTFPFFPFSPNGRFLFILSCLYLLV